MPAFLRHANQIEGVLLIVAVAKDINTIFEVGDSETEKADKARLGIWKPGVHEHLIRVLTFSALLISMTAVTFQNLLWIFDQDEIASNDDQLVKLTELFGNVYSNLQGPFLGHIRIGTTKSDNGTLELEDLAAIPDLAAGAVCESLSKRYSDLKRPAKGLIHPMPFHLSYKSKYLLQWMSDDRAPLRKVVLLINWSSDKKSKYVTTIKFDKINPPLA